MGPLPHGICVIKEQWETLVTAFNIDSVQTRNAQTSALSCVLFCTLRECLDLDRLDVLNLRECFDPEHPSRQTSNGWKSWINVYFVPSESVRTRCGSYARQEIGSIGLESLFGRYTKPTGNSVVQSLSASACLPLASRTVPMIDE